MSYVTDTLEQELQLEKRLTPRLELYVDTDPAMTAVNSMQLLEMKGIHSGWKKSQLKVAN